MLLAELFTESLRPDCPHHLSRDHSNAYDEARRLSFKYYISMPWLTSSKRMSTHASQAQPLVALQQSGG